MKQEIKAFNEVRILRLILVLANVREAAQVFATIHVAVSQIIVKYSIDDWNAFAMHVYTYSQSPQMRGEQVSIVQ